MSRMDRVPTLAGLEITLSCGTIDYVDTGGDGPVVLLLHGMLMDASLWDGVIEALGPQHRCVAPTLPLGAHQRPVAPGTDLSPWGIAGLVAELMERLDLREVTLVGNDTGGALAQLLIGGAAVDPSAHARIARVVLASCEAFDNWPPGLTGRTLELMGRLPGPLLGVFLQQLRLRPVRRLPIAFGWLTRYGDSATARWIRPLLTSPRIREDTRRMLRLAFADHDLLLDNADRLSTFDRPALVAWARGDRVMPTEHGRRLADLLPQGRLVQVDDSDTLLPLDQPAALAGLLADFARSGAGTR